MPLIHSWTLRPATRVAVWKIAEEEEFFSAVAGTGGPPAAGSSARRLQWLAGRHLLGLLQPGFPTATIRPGAGGKPEAPDGPHFSISHSGPYVAAAICPSCPVGLDIQRPDARAVALRPKFLSPEEDGFFPFTAHDSLTAFAAKEAAYKWQGLRGVDWKVHMAVRSLARSGHSWKALISMQRCEPAVDLVVEGWDWPAFTIAVAAH